ncbi:MAG TPA: LysM peptidoglycan-binding domain-containing protein [Pirellulales bacterium]|nr:LysM peptidoglycan-binding domain-containing protein [Pirellulales bacterium]
MDRRKKIILAAVVLALGVALALQYRKIEQVKSHSSPGSTWREAVQPTVSNPTTSNAAPGAGQQPAATTAFDGRIEAAPGSSNSQENESTHSSSLAPTVAPPDSMVDLDAPEQTHKIVDGDTLQNLAQRYLGRADRYLELYEYNRDVLRSPEVLPIGAELRIPSKVALPAAGDTSLLPSAPATPIAPLVPLPAAPTAAGKTASAVAAQRASQRTYTVQPGDNLVDLARRFYGDGRRYESLYEANRRVMHNPTDLRPGMVLVVP